MYFCGNCGTKNEDNAIFCVECGAKIKEREEVFPKMDEKAKAVPKSKKAKTPPVKKERNVSPQKKLKQLGVLQTILMIFIVVAAIAMVFLIAFRSGGENDKKDSAHVSQSVDSEETFETELDENSVSDPSQELRSLLYGTWGVYYGDVLQTITIQKDGTMHVWDGSYEQVMDYTWVNDTTIQVGELGYIYADGQLVLYENGEQTPFIYQHCPALEGSPNTGAASYEEVFTILTQEYLFSEAQVKCMTNVSKGAICEEILRNQYGISGQESAGEFLRMISQSDEALAEQFNDYYFEQGGISRMKLSITEWVPRSDMIGLFQQEQENYQAGESPLHKQYVWELARAQMCWVAVGEVLYENGESVPLNTDTQQKGVLYLFQIDGRFYWFWSELG